MQVDAELEGVLPEQESFDYAGFCRWRDHDVEADRAYWLDQAASEPSRLLIAAPVEPVPDGYVEIVATVRPEELRAGAGVPPMAVAAAALATALRPYHAGAGVEFSFVSSTRTHERATKLFGYLLNPIPIRLDVELGRTLHDLLEEAATKLGSALAHRGYPISRISEDRFRNGRALPVRNVLLSVDDAPAMTLGGNSVRPAQALTFSTDAVADLAFFVTFRDDQVLLGLESSGTSVDASVVASLLHELDAALTATLRAPGRTLGDVLAEPARASRSAEYST